MKSEDLEKELKPCQFFSADMLSHEIVVKGNCTACGKPLGKNDGLFLCVECQKKNKEEE